MQIRINVKGASRKKASIIQQVREYPDTCMTVEEFLAETVRQNVKEYNARKDAGAEKLLAGLLGEQDSVPAGIAATTKAVPPGPEEAGAQAGKVTYGDSMDDRKADAEKAVLNALQCFDDGIVALFADGVRYTRREEQIPLKDQSEVTFVRLTFLAGRMW